MRIVAQIRSALAAISIIVVFSSAAQAVTIASVTGSGDLDLTATGSVYFDASDLDLTRLELTATETVTIAATFPDGGPGAATDTLELLDLVLTTGLSVDDDVSIAPFDFTGSVSVAASSIYVIGPIAAEIIVINGPAVVVETDLLPGFDSACGGSSAGATITTGSSVGAPSGGCSVELGPIDGGTIEVDPIGITPGGPGLAPIPEPGAALLYAAGALALCASRPGRRARQR